MTPEQSRKLDELYAWMLERKHQQIAYPLDEASLATIGAVVAGPLGGAALTQSYNVTGGGGGSITGPKAYSDTLIIYADGHRREIPIL